MHPYLTEDGDATLIDLWVVPGASRSQIDGPHGDLLKVRVTASPEQGKANRAVAELLAAELGTAVDLVSGAGGRRKRVRVDAPIDAVTARLPG